MNKLNEENHINNHTLTVQKNKKPRKPRTKLPPLEQRYTERRIIQSLIDNKGMLTDVAADLNCTYAQIWRYLENNEDVAEIYHTIKESLVDLAEMKLHESIERGNTAAILFALRTKGKSRGWNETAEINVKVMSDAEKTNIIKSIFNKTDETVEKDE